MDLRKNFLAWGVRSKGVSNMKVVSIFYVSYYLQDYLPWF